MLLLGPSCSLIRKAPTITLTVEMRPEEAAQGPAPTPTSSFPILGLLSSPPPGVGSNRGPPHPHQGRFFSVLPPPQGWLFVEGLTWSCRQGLEVGVPGS